MKKFSNKLLFLCWKEIIEAAAAFTYFTKIPRTNKQTKIKDEDEKTKEIRALKTFTSILPSNRYIALQ